MRTESVIIRSVPNRHARGQEAVFGSSDPWIAKRLRKVSSAREGSARADAVLGHEEVFGKKGVFRGGERLRMETGVGCTPGEGSVFRKHLRAGHFRPRSG